MQFIKATDKHTEQIVELLKITLGEHSTKKTIDFWNWKHNENPFDTSTVLLAFDDNLLIGVRAFLKWKFVKEDKEITCARAVDTAVHPNYQGKGLFTKLTIQAIEELKKDGVDLIFNTPNQASKGGYLKMGWIENGKLPITISLGSLIPKHYDKKFIEHIEEKYALLNNINFKPSLTSNFISPLHNEYIIWRYKNCPINRYCYIQKEDSFLIIVRLKKVKSFIELRVCDVVLNDDTIFLYEAKKSLQKLVKEVKPLIVTSSFHNKKIHNHFVAFTKSIGPIVTLKEVAKVNNINSFKGFINWQPSIGCLELF